MKFKRKTNIHFNLHARDVSDDRNDRDTSDIPDNRDIRYVPDDRDPRHASDIPDNRDLKKFMYLISR